MFESLSEGLGKVFDRLGRRGHLTLKDIEEASGEVRVALLEADVALPVVTEVIDRLKDASVGEAVTKSVTPVQELVKRTHDILVEILKFPEGESGGGVWEKLTKGVRVPEVVLMVGLQGSGKTTTTAKLGKYLKEKEKKRVLMASLDVYRPGAKEQLRILGDRVGLGVLEEKEGESPQGTAKRSLEEARLGGYEVVLLDTAGRLTIDEELMREVREIREVLGSCVSLLVSDAMAGQDAARTAGSFREAVGVDGIVLTRLDGDSRGGAALSMSAVSGCGVLFAGVGEGLGDMELFDAERVAGRILGMGDVVSLVEKARDVVSEEEGEKALARMAKGQFDMDDLLGQLGQLEKMGGFASMMSMIPGMGKLAKGGLMDDEEGSKMIRRQMAIIRAMTKKERRDVRLLHASRKKRIAAGSGVEVSEVNKLLKQYQGMSKMMKKMGPSLRKEMAEAGGGGGMGDVRGMAGMKGMRGLPGLPGGSIGGGSSELSRLLSMGKRRG
jgi:signal recognition particle subunit SRP54